MRHYTRMLVAASAFGLSFTVPVIAAPSGNLDPTFSGDGKATVSFGNGSLPFAASLLSLAVTVSVRDCKNPSVPTYL